MRARSSLMGERKPAWLRLIAPDRNPQKLTPVKCSGCGRWCIEQHGATQWDKWDAGIITGDDLTVAIILNRTLVRVERTPAGGVLSTVCGGLGIDPHGEYLAMHDCTQPPISSREWKPLPKRERGQDLSWLPHSTPIPGADPWASTLDPIQGTLPY